MKEYLLIQVAAAAAIGIAAWRTLPETMMCAACGQLQRRKEFSRSVSYTHLAHGGQNDALRQIAEQLPVMLDHGNNAGHIVINGGDDLFQGSFPLHGDVIIGYVVFYGCLLYTSRCV